MVPHELRIAFEDYIHELKVEAEKEYYNRGIRKFSGSKTNKNIKLFERSYSNKGSILEVNNNFPLVKNLQESLDKSQNSQLNLLLRMINNRVNNIRHVHEEKEFIGIEEKDGISEEELYDIILKLLSNGTTVEMISEGIIPHLGFKYSSLPENIRLLIK